MHKACSKVLRHAFSRTLRGPITSTKARNRHTPGHHWRRIRGATWVALVEESRLGMELSSKLQQVPQRMAVVRLTSLVLKMHTSLVLKRHACLGLLVAKMIGAPNSTPLLYFTVLAVSMYMRGMTCMPRPPPSKSGLPSLPWYTSPRLSGTSNLITT
ncbi:hypothetical protein PVAP13_9KG069820 [Panicum virgatum]|uniref:Uncharacterized protein n=1 Tax=Panicum virgatum TaxID=38727 RepID=A0A8T0NK12_PANVG|nr:hypothetical protein PVAP13_9KG069820 [Panicum virgatum]